MAKIKKILVSLLILSLLASSMGLLGCEEITQEEMSSIMEGIETAIDEADAALGDAAAKEPSGETADDNAASDGTHTIRIISTSDLHGKMLGYDYALDQPDASGSIAQAASAIKEYRNDNTVLVDVGDAIQDNLADIFNNEEVHPMMQALNKIGYDICTAGNHEFNYGMDVTMKYIKGCDCDFILGNVYDENGELLADPYKIIEKDGVRIAFIGMVSPNIANWDKKNLAGYTVTDPAMETNKIIDNLESVDIIVGVLHMMEDDEYKTPNSGFASMAQSCPRLNLILGSHGHTLVNKNLSNNIPVTENLNAGKSIQVADITVEVKETSNSAAGTTNRSSSIKEIKTTYVETKDYPEDPELVTLLTSYDSRAKEYARTRIGELKDGPLVPENEIHDISAMLTTPTPLVSLVHNVMMHYAEADAAIANPCTNEDNAQPGELTLASVCRMYKYGNTLYSVKMTGSQIKKYLEWSVSFYQQYQEGDLTLAFEDTPVYMLDSMSGVNYVIDVSKPVGERIVSLTYPDGKPLKDDDELTVAVNNYRYNSAISIPGVIFDEDDIPELIASDIRSDLGDIRFLIIDYITNVKKGTITPECNDNWEIIGNDWDPELHQKAVELINNGTIQLTEGAKNNPCVVKITVDDLP